MGETTSTKGIVASFPASSRGRDSTSIISRQEWSAGGPPVQFREGHRLAPFTFATTAAGHQRREAGLGAASFSLRAPPPLAALPPATRGSHGFSRRRKRRSEHFALLCLHNPRTLATFFSVFVACVNASDQRSAMAAPIAAGRGDQRPGHCRRRRERPLSGQSWTDDFRVLSVGSAGSNSHGSRHTRLRVCGPG